MDLDNLKKDLEKDYSEKFEGEYTELYNEYIKYADDLYLPIKTNSSFNNFCKFIQSYSSHKEDYIEQEVSKYLDEYNRQKNEDFAADENYDDYINY